ncbi:MAG: tetratricopeptide repeat protein [Bacteroidaceae bacterium]|nr:tetratricopeptide repeat protein [Bacteroidaceae bacterium]
MNKIKKAIILFISGILCISLQAQTLQQGRNLFAKGDYEAAKPIMLKYLKQKPADASRNYWYGVCLMETGYPEEAIAYLNKSIPKIVRAYRYIGDYYCAKELYAEAIDNYELFVSGFKADKELHNDSTEDLYTQKADSLRTLFRMIRNTNKVCVIDSFIVSKDELFNSYITDASTGSFSSYSEFFNQDIQGDVFLPEMENSVVFSRQENGKFKLYQSFRSFDSWVDESAINGLESDGDLRYPFIQNDGITIYYADNGSNSIGGYDIFVSRYNSSTDRYLVPENIGMPFNSPANDYLYVIDEVNNLGWFATDRRQPEDTVCIYVFIPDERRSKYNYEGGDTTAIHNAAKLMSIKETQTDLEEVRAARQRLTLLAYDIRDKEKQTENIFVIDDLTDYRSENDFQSPEARTLYLRWLDIRNTYSDDVIRLENMRTKYHQSSKQEKEEMKNQLLELENSVLSAEASIISMEIEIRNTEIKYITR